jgi:hypothetical protein
VGKRISYLVSEKRVEQEDLDNHAGGDLINL